MIALYMDLDNTAIYSHRHDIGPRKRCVEWYRGRAVSFVTEQALALLWELRRRVLIVPTTTRTVEQYERIDLRSGAFSYALVCNGGILLLDGKRDARWYEESLRLAREGRTALEEALRLLERDERRCFPLRFIEELFVFTKCEKPESVAADLKSRPGMQHVDVLCNGTKLYVIPKSLNKGAALKRLEGRLANDFVIAAGDSAFDISMLREADLGLAPYGFQNRFGVNFAVEETEEGALFSEAFLERVWELSEK